MGESSKYSAIPTTVDRKMGARVSHEFSGSRTCVPMAFTTESPSAQEQLSLFPHPLLVPAPSETCWFRGMSVGGSFRRV